MIYIILVLICLSLYIDYFLSSFIGGSQSFLYMWKSRFNSFLLNRKFDTNLTFYESQFTNNNLFFYTNKGEVYSEDFLLIELYFKNKIISFTYFYQDFLNDDNHSVIDTIYLNQLALQYDYGSKMNYYLKMLPYSQEIEKNASFIIHKMLEQETSLDFQEQFSRHRQKLVQQLQNELDKL